jgi:hypothetical protein
MKDTIEKRIMKSNLSDDDKIEIIKRLNSNKEYIYVYPPTVPYSYTTATNTTATSGYLSSNTMPGIPRGDSND